MTMMDVVMSNRCVRLSACRQPGAVLQPRPFSFAEKRLHRSIICSCVMASSTADIEISVGSSCAMTLKADIGV